ncbi:hypothetical protein [Gorillibacterium sp. sgz5001074]|uniref:hypothetical protein n=1 Tax=Gorillibacterium sp. sgz5001074 TaxID=3446695 RepID=UPI003F674C1D
MRRIRPGRLLLTIFLLAFAVFFGLDLATRGMERVQGPAEQVGKPAVVAHQPETRPAAVKPAAASPSAAAGTAGSGTTGKTASAGAGAASGQKVQAASAQPGAKSQAEPPKIEVKESFLNHLSNRVGDALHHIAKAIMGMIVSLFDALVT